MRESCGGHVSEGHKPVSVRENAVAMPMDTLRNSEALAEHLRKFLDRFFYLGMSLLVAAVVIFGFSHTIGDNLLHPDRPRPLILPIHAMVFSAWLALFIAVRPGALIKARLASMPGYFRCRARRNTPRFRHSDGPGDGALARRG